MIDDLPAVRAPGELKVIALVFIWVQELITPHNQPATRQGNTVSLPTNNLTILLSTVALSACATSKEVYISDGTRGYSINCSGSLLNWDSCYERAGEICSAEGYEVLEKTGKDGLTVQSDHSTLQRGSIVHRSMVIQCNE